MDLNLGKHCSVHTCKQLDFLPFTCDACGRIFCGDHRQYESHSCTESYAKNRTVPVCPVCASPVPVKRGEDPNLKMNMHIDQGCRTAPKSEKPAFTNACAKKGCKKREAVPLLCPACNKNHCFAHRLDVNHDCEGKASVTAKAAEQRRKVNQGPQPQPVSAKQGQRWFSSSAAQTPKDPSPAVQSSKNCTLS